MEARRAIPSKETRTALSLDKPSLLMEVRLNLGLDPALVVVGRDSDASTRAKNAAN
jgi:hypothetical protein